MSTALAFVLLILSKYLVPFLFVIGLVHFIYGVIEYYIIGKGGDEGRAQHGREILLKSITWFLLAILVHLVVLLLGWLGTISLSGNLNAPPRDSGGVERNESIFRVPNVPTRE